MPNVLVDLIFITVLLAGHYFAYRAGFNDGRREVQRQRRKPPPETDLPIYMDHTHGGDPDDPT